MLVWFFAKKSLPSTVYEQRARMLAYYQYAMSGLWHSACSNIPEWISVTEFNESSAVVIVTSLALAIIWPGMRHLFKRLSSSFRALSENKQLYVVANVSKALCLAVVCMHPSFFADLSDLFHGKIIAGDSRSMWIKRSSALYISSDLVALFVVPKLPSTTVAHHIITIVLALSLFATKVDCGNIALMIGVYGAWSSLAWPVNLFLALRCVYPKRWWMKCLALLAMIVYFASCAFNWLWHTVWFWNQISSEGALLHWHGWLVFAYGIAVAGVARDDLILLTWLLLFF